MNVADFKRWHWMIVGLLVGLALSYIWLGFEPAPEMRLNPLQFERLVGAKDEKSGALLLSNIVVHPPQEDYQGKKVQIVSGKRLVRVAKKDQLAKLRTGGGDIDSVPTALKRLPFEMVAPIPYTPEINRGVELKPDGNVMDYLKALEAQKVEVGFHYGWWRTPPVAISLWTVGGVLAIGGVWPTLLNVLVGAGFGPVKHEKAEGMGLLSGFGKKRKPDSKPVVKLGTSLAEQQKLDALNAKLEGDLAAAGIVQTEAVPMNDDSSAGVVVPGVKVLASSAVDTPKTGTAASDESKEYGGEFYPVAKPHHHVEEPKKK